MGQEIRAQKSPSAMSKGGEAEKKPFSSCPHLSAGWCLPSNLLLEVRLQAQLQHRLGDAGGFFCQATTASPHLWTGLDPLWSTSKTSSLTYLRYKRPAGGLGGIYLLSWAKETPQNSQEIHRMKNPSFCSTWSIKPKKYSSKSFVNKYRAPRQCRWFIGT